MGIPTKEEIIAKVSEYSKKDHSLIEKAYDFSQKAHEGQVRESGDPFFKHPANSVFAGHLKNAFFDYIPSDVRMQACIQLIPAENHCLILVELRKRSIFSCRRNC